MVSSSCVLLRLKAHYLGDPLTFLDGCYDILPLDPVQERQRLVQSVRQMLSSVQPGKGVSIIASGSWGSGKSQVIGTLPSPQPKGCKPLNGSGVLKIALETLLPLEKPRDGSQQHQDSCISISCYEVIGDEVYDLMSDQWAGPNGSLKQHLQQQHRLRSRILRTMNTASSHLNALSNNRATTSSRLMTNGCGSSDAIKLKRQAESLRKSFVSQSSSRHMTWAPSTGPGEERVHTSTKTVPAKTSSKPAAHSTSRPLQVQSLVTVRAASAQDAADIIAAALTRRSAIEVEGRAHCHLGHAIVRITWTSPPASLATVSTPNIGMRSKRDTASAASGLAAPQRAFSGASIPALRTLTLVDCCSSAAAGLLPERWSSAAKLGSMSLGRALSNLHRGEAAMRLRESQLTRSLIGSTDSVLFLACIGGTHDLPISELLSSSINNVRSSSSNSWAGASLGAPPSPSAMAAAADEATLQLVRSLTCRHSSKESSSTVAPDAAADVIRTAATGVGDLGRSSSFPSGSNGHSLEGFKTGGKVSGRSHPLLMRRGKQMLLMSPPPPLILPDTLIPLPGQCSSPCSASFHSPDTLQEGQALDPLLSTYADSTLSAPRTPGSASSMYSFSSRKSMNEGNTAPGGVVPGLRPRWLSGSRIPRPPGAVSPLASPFNSLQQETSSRAPVKAPTDPQSRLDQLQLSVAEQLAEESIALAQLTLRRKFNPPDKDSRTKGYHSKQVLGGRPSTLLPFPTTPSPSKRHAIVSASPSPSSSLFPLPNSALSAADTASVVDAASRMKMNSPHKLHPYQGARAGGSPLKRQNLIFISPSNPSSGSANRLKPVHERHPSAPARSSRWGSAGRPYYPRQPTSSLHQGHTAHQGGRKHYIGALASRLAGGVGNTLSSELNRRRSRSALSALYRHLLSGPNRARLEEQYMVLLDEFQQFQKLPRLRSIESGISARTLVLHTEGAAVCTAGSTNGEASAVTPLDGSTFSWIRCSPKENVSSNPCVRVGLDGVVEEDEMCHPRALGMAGEKSEGSFAGFKTSTSDTVPSLRLHLQSGDDDTRIPAEQGAGDWKQQVNFTTVNLAGRRTVNVLAANAHDYNKEEEEEEDSLFTLHVPQALFSDTSHVDNISAAPTEYHSKRPSAKHAPSQSLHQSSTPFHTPLNLLPHSSSASTRENAASHPRPHHPLPRNQPILSHLDPQRPHQPLDHMLPSLKRNPHEPQQLRSQGLEASSHKALDNYDLISLVLTDRCSKSGKGLKTQARISGLLSLKHAEGRPGAPAPVFTQQAPLSLAMRQQLALQKHLSRTAAPSLVSKGREQQQQQPLWAGASSARTGLGLLPALSPDARPLPLPQQLQHVWNRYSEVKFDDKRSSGGGTAVPCTAPQEPSTLNNHVPSHQSCAHAPADAATTYFHTANNPINIAQQGAQDFHSKKQKKYEVSAAALLRADGLSRDPPAAMMISAFTVLQVQSAEDDVLPAPLPPCTMASADHLLLQGTDELPAPLPSSTMASADHLLLQGTDELPNGEVLRRAAIFESLVTSHSSHSSLDHYAPSSAAISIITSKEYKQPTNQYLASLSQSAKSDGYQGGFTKSDTNVRNAMPLPAVLFGGCNEETQTHKPLTIMKDAMFGSCNHETPAAALELLEPIMVKDGTSQPAAAEPSQTYTASSTSPRTALPTSPLAAVAASSSKENVEGMQQSVVSLMRDRGLLDLDEDSDVVCLYSDAGDGGLEVPTTTTLEVPTTTTLEVPTSTTLEVPTTTTLEVPTSTTLEVPTYYHLGGPHYYHLGGPHYYHLGGPPLPTTLEVPTTTTLEVPTTTTLEVPTTTTLEVPTTTTLEVPTTTTLTQRAAGIMMMDGNGTRPQQMISTRGNLAVDHKTTAAAAALPPQPIMTNDRKALHQEYSTSSSMPSSPAIPAASMMTVNKHSAGSSGNAESVTSTVVSSGTADTADPSSMMMRKSTSSMMRKPFVWLDKMMTRMRSRRYSQQDVSEL
ncbi:hypothetical protein CEUSTIGMA_g13837.t1 [Chlamydomonas eustigma]|uniref:Kinesin motor domain-containing protein n=1 Tax=Chlamydomonas eustigma TaxID=1157962 RepID=A0A250XTN6_9CHLO|nr:hypothetical protein CEUSTIGMA_g13837.t1 [Chlamydomonas eustigma]|eukprot:GAX86427.1 hypothetical protein CEUSTIGMA_g13837.t1 [Chlamydomonas eustigma]